MHVCVRACVCQGEKTSERKAFSVFVLGVFVYTVCVSV